MEAIGQNQGISFLFYEVMFTVHSTRKQITVRKSCMS